MEPNTRTLIPQLPITFILQTKDHFITHAQKESGFSTTQVSLTAEFLYVRNAEKHRNRNDKKRNTRSLLMATQ